MYLFCDFIKKTTKELIRWSDLLVRVNFSFFHTLVKEIDKNFNNVLSFTFFVEQISENCLIFFSWKQIHIGSVILEVNQLISRNFLLKNGDSTTATVWKLREFSLKHFWQKFRGSHYRVDLTKYFFGEREILVFTQHEKAVPQLCNSLTCKKR